MTTGRRLASISKSWPYIGGSNLPTQLLRGPFPAELSAPALQSLPIGLNYVVLYALAHSEPTGGPELVVALQGNAYGSCSSKFFDWVAVLEKEEDGGASEDGPPRVNFPAVGAVVPAGAHYVAEAAAGGTIVVGPADDAVARIGLLIEQASADQHRSNPTPAARGAAEVFLRRLENLGLPIPRPLLDNAGEILLFGRKGGAYLDLGFQPDGTISFFARRGAGCPMTGDHLKPDFEIGEELASMFYEVA